MNFAVPDHIAYCFSQDRPIFLDIARDRYFTVSKRLGQAFGAFVREGLADEADGSVGALIEHGLLSPAGDSARVRRTMVTVRRERAAVPVRLRTGQAFAVATALWSARRSLRSRSFSTVIDGLRDRREPGVRHDPERMRELSGGFLRHRHVVPMRSVCLLDSIALLNFLDTHGAQADLVFGVTASPFSAHCWIQQDDEVLNDHLDRVMAFTPILVV